jgi:tellurite resistance protein
MFFTLYYIPLIPLDLVGEEIVCTQCSAEFGVDALAFDPIANAEYERLQIFKAVRRVLAVMSMVDGDPEEAEIEQMMRIMSDVAERSVSRDEIEEELADLFASPVEIAGHCRRMTGYMEPHACELVVEAAILVAAADNDFNEDKRSVLSTIAEALEVPPDRVAELVSKTLADRGNATSTAT